MNKVQVEILNDLDYSFFENINFLDNLLEYVNKIKQEAENIRNSNPSEMV